MKKEVQIFLTAVMFYTRLPCPSWVDHSPDYLNKATRYFPAMGIIAGIIAYAVFYMASLVFSLPISIALSMLSSIWLTGAFHEDGFADVCDGFGGGWTKEKILAIMKDSQIGTYGAIGLLSILGIKFLLLNEMLGALMQQGSSQLAIASFFINAHVLSRFMPTTFIYTHEYVRENEDSKAKPIAKGITTSNLIIAGFIAFLSLLLWIDKSILVTVLLPMYAAKIYLAHYFKKWIGGYTGDCLGATQQVTEIVFYLAVLAIWKFI